MLNVRDIPRYEAMGEYARRYPELDPAASESFLVLLHTGDRLKTLVEQHLQRVGGMSHGRFVVLALLNRDPDKPLPASELAARIGVTKQTMTSLLDGLEKDRYVRRLDHAEDRRVCLVGLTPHGRKFLEAVLPGLFKAHTHLMSALSQPEQRQLADLLRKLWTSIEAGLNTPTPPNP